MRTSSASTAPAPSLRRALACSLVFVAAALGLAASIAVPAASAEPLAEKQAQAAELDRQVGKLEDRYGDLQERWRGALVELRELQADVEDSQAKLKVARRDLHGARARLTERALAIYRDGGGSSNLLQVAQAGSVTEFFNRVDTIERVSDQDADILARVRDAERQVQRQELRLRTARNAQAKVVKRAATSKRKMKQVLVDKQTALSSVTAEIRTIMEQRRAAAAAADAAAARGRAVQLAAGGSVSSVTGGDATTNGGGGAEAEGSPAGGTGGAEAGTSANPSAGAPGGAAPAVPLPPASGSASAAASIAMGKIGAPYSFGAAGPSSFDCSGLVVWAFAQAGRPGLPHSTYSLIGMGVEVSLSQAQVGDLVFTNNAGHMGIYVGGGSFVHAPRTGRTVTVEGLGNYTVVAIRRI